MCPARNPGEELMAHQDELTSKWNYCLQNLIGQPVLENPGQLASIIFLSRSCTFPFSNQHPYRQMMRVYQHVRSSICQCSFRRTIQPNLVPPYRE